MGWREALFGSRQRYVQAPLNPGETVQQTWVGARTAGGGLPFTGGQLAITDDRLIFNPLNTERAQKLLAVGARAAGIPAVGLGLRALRHTGVFDPKTMPLDSVTSVEPGRQAGVVHPPTVVVDGPLGRHEFGVVDGLATPNWSARNVPARDALVAALRSRAG